MKLAAKEFGRILNFQEKKEENKTCEVASENGEEVFGEGFVLCFGV